MLYTKDSPWFWVIECHKIDTALTCKGYHLRGLPWPLVMTHLSHDLLINIYWYFQYFRMRSIRDFIASFPLINSGYRIAFNTIAGWKKKSNIAISYEWPTIIGFLRVNFWSCCVKQSLYLLLLFLHMVLIPRKIDVKF